MSGDNISSKIDGTLKAVALAGLLALTGGLVSKIWDALPPFAASALLTLGLLFAFTFPAWRLFNAHLVKEVARARSAFATEREKDDAEQLVRDRLAAWVVAALGVSFIFGGLTATWVCVLLQLPTPTELVRWLFVE
ncbi:hypothetical protein [Microbacterium sp. 1.5R]|uniref:hypothetical protein n=1 Tax=Microbacterium sp. 1.5R TaxID=1916917 RepID=UPI00119CB0EF|nr:hypothetical protein [Microbacterium sp. 1.5R]